MIFNNRLHQKKWKVKKQYTQYVKWPLGRKISITILFLSVTFSLIEVLVSYNIYSGIVNRNYCSMAGKLANATAVLLNGDTIDRYLKNRIKDDSFDQMEKELYKVKEENDIQTVMVFKFINNKILYILGNDLSEKQPDFIEWNGLLDHYKPYFAQRKDGLPTSTISGFFGCRCVAFKPVYNSTGEVSAYVGVSISMMDNLYDRIQYLILITLLMVINVILLTVIAVFLIKKHIVSPIKKLSSAVGDFIAGNNTETTEENYGNQVIMKQSGNEIEVLTTAIKSLEKDLMDYNQSLTKVMAEKDKIAAELSYASSIREGLMPALYQSFPKEREYEIYASIRTAKEACGDFYDYFLLDNERLGFVLADTSGKGVIAALFMVVAKTLIRNQAHLCSSPSEVFNIVNKILYESKKTGMFVTAFLGILNLKTGELNFSNAGHKDPLIYRTGEGYCFIRTKPDFVLAGMEGIQYNSYNLQLRPGDRLFLYTDGLTDAINSSRIHYGELRLYEVLNNKITKRMKLSELNDYVIEDIDNFTQGVSQKDDISLMLIEFKDYYLYDGTNR